VNILEEKLKAISSQDSERTLTEARVFTLKEQMTRILEDTLTRSQQPRSRYHREGSMKPPRRMQSQMVDFKLNFNHITNSGIVGVQQQIAS